MEYSKCLVELNEVICHLEKESLEKIPYDIRKTIALQMDKRYAWHYDETKGLDEQNINRKTIAMLSYLNMKYLLNVEQRKLMAEYHKSNEVKAKKEKQSDYGKFTDHLKKEEKTVQKDENVALIKATSPKWHEKLSLFIKNIFQKY